MSDRKLIGRVSATEKYPSSCDDFQFWLSDDAILSPFDIVRVENKTDDSVTYGVVQDILHITDGTGHLSNYVSSDFGNVDTTPMTRRLSLSYAKVSVIHNTKENFMPVFEGSPVYTADSNDIEIALGLDNIDEKTAIPAGLMKASNNVAVPIKYNGDFLIGPEGAHMNISGISGLATKTSYVMFLLKAIQHKYKDDVAIIVMNVKGDDLLHVHQPNEKITPAQREEWDTLGVPCEPFENVKYLYPFRKQKDMFAGEIHALHTDLIPNSQRDDFEPNAIYGELRQALGKWAGEINKKYRRGMSEATSALRRLNQLNTAQKELEDKIDSGAITSDEKREQFAEQLKQIAKKREAEEKTVRKAQERGTFDVDRKETIEKVLAQTETASKKMTSLNKKVVNADYATKHDLPSSYSRDERKLYQRIITVIDTYFAEDPKTAEKLREAIKSELSVKKK